MDWRGQGLSDRDLKDSRKGHVDDFGFFERDLDALHQQVLQFLCPEPWFALGHSMGGAILLAQARAGRSPFARMVLSAPMIDIARLRFPRLIRALMEGLDMVGLGTAYVPGGSRKATRSNTSSASVRCRSAATVSPAASSASPRQRLQSAATIGSAGSAFAAASRTDWSRPA